MTVLRRLGVFLLILVVLQLTQLNNLIRSIISRKNETIQIKPTPSLQLDERDHRRQYHEITFTSIGWNHPNKARAINCRRSIATREFVDAVVAHKRFNAAAWMNNNNNSNIANSGRPVLAFLDFDACALMHYPLFGGGDGKVNADTQHGRPTGRASLDKICQMVDNVLQQQHISALRHKDSRLVVLSCDGNGLHGRIHLPVSHCLHRNRNMTKYSKLVVGHMSATFDDVHASNDFGLPPWPVKRVHMQKKQLKDMEDCIERPIEFSFKGRDRIDGDFPGFHEYFGKMSKSNINSNKYRIEFSREHYNKSPLQSSGRKQIAPTPIHNQTLEQYYAWIMNSTFCLAPRGDVLYSVRFSEVMSAGCIPIVYSDGLVLPYDSHVVKDWDSVLVMIPQSEVNRTQEVIEKISVERRCQMQKNVFEFYNNYVKNSSGRLDAILQLMDARLNHQEGAMNVRHVPYACQDENGNKCIVPSPIVSS